MFSVCVYLSVVICIRPYTCTRAPRQKAGVWERTSVEASTHAAFPRNIMCRAFCQCVQVLYKHAPDLRPRSSGQSFARP